MLAGVVDQGRLQSAEEIALMNALVTRALAPPKTIPIDKAVRSRMADILAASYRKRPRIVESMFHFWPPNSNPARRVLLIERPVSKARYPANSPAFMAIALR